MNKQTCSLAGCMDLSGPLMIFAAVFITLIVIRAADAGAPSISLIDEPQVIAADHSAPNDLVDPVAMACHKNKDHLLAGANPSKCRPE